jgi:hypothetical protein
MNKQKLAKRMQKLMALLPEPGEASSNQPYNITMFKMSLLTFLETERLNILTWALIGLTAILAALTIVLIIFAANQ